MSVRYENPLGRFCCWYTINRKVKGNIKDNFHLLAQRCDYFVVAGLVNRCWFRTILVKVSNDIVVMIIEFRAFVN